jgi:hypothetical protein
MCWSKGLWEIRWNCDLDSFSVCRMAGSMELPAKGGFSFDLCRRNAMLEKSGLKMPGFRKTGTTIVGLVFQVRSD